MTGDHFMATLCRLDVFLLFTFLNIISNSRYQHFYNCVKGQCTFGEVNVDLCKKFREYLLNAKQLKHSNRPISLNSASGYYSTFRGLLKIAYRDKWLRENINDYLGNYNQTISVFPPSCQSPYTDSHDGTVVFSDRLNFLHGSN